MSVSTNTDWISPTTCANLAVSGENWLRSFGVEIPATLQGTETGSSDNARALNALAPSANPTDILISGFGSGISAAVPSNATIDGIEVRVEGYKSSGASPNDTLTYAALYSDASGTLVSGTSADAIVLPTGSSTAEAYVTTGGAADLWGAGSITRATIASSDFRVGVYALSTVISNYVYVDHVQIKVYYTYTPAPPNSFFFWDL